MHKMLKKLVEKLRAKFPATTPGCGRRGGLMVSGLDSAANGPGLSPSNHENKQVRYSFQISCSYTRKGVKRKQSRERLSRLQVAYLNHS